MGCTPNSNKALRNTAAVKRLKTNVPLRATGVRSVDRRVISESWGERRSELAKWETPFDDKSYKAQRPAQVAEYVGLVSQSFRFGCLGRRCEPFRKREPYFNCWTRAAMSGDSVIL